MSTRKKPNNFVQRLLRRIWRLFSTATKVLTNWVLRSLMVHRRRSRQSQAGFVLPTVVMVLLVVVLLTTAIVIRSFDRSKNASNYRVNEAILNAATPALDRGRAKLQFMFSPEENDIEGNTPTEDNIAGVLKNDRYTFGDETRLTLADNTGGTRQTLETAWKFPVDTNNNGKFDTFILYGIYFRNPEFQNGNPTRARTPLEARALPQAEAGSGKCGGEVAGGTAGWFPIGGKLKKAFFTYVASVPITQLPTTAYKGTIAVDKFETYKGNQGFSALEMQQDLSRVALDNNAVWYENDIEINASSILRLNGRVHSNSNLMVSGPSGAYINFLQVSSPASCYYDPENAKIVVGGNVAAGGPGALDDSYQPAPNTDFANDTIKVDLYRGEGTPPTTTVINNQNKTTQETPLEVASNSDAFAKRLDLLVEGAMKLYTASNTDITPALVKAFGPFPLEIGQNFEPKYDASNPKNNEKSLRQTIDTYFRERIRRVSYAEVPPNALPDQAVYRPGTTTALTPDTVFAGAVKIAAPREWMLIEDPGNGSVERYTKLPLVFRGGNTMELEAERIGGDGIEEEIGNRVQVGNGLPNRWVDTTQPPTSDKYYAPEGKPKPVFRNGTTQVNWNGSGSQRQRKGLVQVLDDLGDTSRGGFWEQAAAKLEGGRFLNSTKTPKLDEELAGGLRVITGAGIYVDGASTVGNAGTGKRMGDSQVPKTDPNWFAEVKSFLPAPPKPSELAVNNVNIPDLTAIPNRAVNDPTATTADQYFIVVWPDTMPMYQFVPNDPGYDFVAPQGSAQQGDGLKGDLQMRATVVYHYKNPTGADKPLACISSYYDPTDQETATSVKGWTNNGLNYPVPTSRTIDARLRRQARMIYPNGRWVNEPLKRAIEKLDTGTAETELTLDEKAAIDAANCALTILANPAGYTTNPFVPDRAIVEKAFLDARQVKALHRPPVKNVSNTGYDPDPGTLLPSTAATTSKPTEHIANPETLKIAELGQLNPTAPNPPNPPAEYALPIEQRQPLEIRVTEINLGTRAEGGIRDVTIAGSTGTGKEDNQEFLLPNSGIIYASRDDALPDITSGSAGRSSASDFKLDPTRRPNGIRLVNGKKLERKQDYRTAEKGLILASDLPVYIKGDFNLHLESGTNTPVEEFTSVLNMPTTGATPGNFYARGVSDGAVRNEKFACRRGGNNCEGNGDQWRAARILSDAVTLLSNNFRDGYRNEGDYNLNNNAGNSAVKARLKNGFWWNSFATTAEWYDLAATTGWPKDFDTTPDTQGSSYVTNSVTPIQRRVNFREYLMEACTKQPVSECGPQDWFIGVDATGADKLKAAPSIDLATAIPAATNDNAGTTAKLPSGPTGSLKGAARRVAFERNQFGGLVVPGTCAAANAAGAPDPIALAECKATPIGVNGTTTARLNYASTGVAAATLPAPTVPNALWFATTTDTTNTNPSQGISYDTTNNLYYLPYNEEETVSEKQLLLPGTPEFPTAPTLTIPSLNGLTAQDPSDYAVCTASEYSQAYKPETVLTPGQCPAIERVFGTWIALTSTFNPATQAPVTDANGVPVSSVQEFKTLYTPETVPGNGGTATLTATAKINFYNLPSRFDDPSYADGHVPGGTITLNRGNQQDPIFVLRTTDYHAMYFRDRVTLKLEGVDPNNVFWVSEDLMVIDATKPHQLTGNFIGRMDIVGKNFIVNGAPTQPIIQGGRIFGRSVVGPANVMTAMTTTDQPLLVPVLNLHSGDGNPSSNPAEAFPGTFTTNRWLSKATDTTFNAVFVMGDSPSRPLGVTRNPAESGGGLHNFPRFLEKWEEARADGPKTAKISGGFIEFQRSSFATAPFEPIDNPETDNSLFFDGTTPAYTAAADNPAERDFRYKGGGNLSKAPYYRPPVRQWGYDVGLLFQTPDLFSRRFVPPSAGQANEFYREVARDDRWVKTLLCAAQSTGTGTGGYEYAIADSRQRGSCPAGLPQ